MPRPTERSTGARRSVRTALVVGLVAAAVGGATVLAAQAVDSPATASKPAERVDRGLGDVATVFDIGAIDHDVAEATFHVAEQAGAAAAPARSASVGFRALTRGASVIHAPPAGWLIPMVLLAMPRAALGGVVGDDIPPGVDASTVMMNALTAQITGAQAGDTLELRAADGSSQWFTVGRILPYDEIGGTELLMTPEAANRLGVFDDTQMVVWGIGSRVAFDDAVHAAGLDSRPQTKVNRSWDPRDPDDTLSTARTKSLLGEPWYRVIGDNAIEMHPTWKATYLPPGLELLSSAVPVSARCHVTVAPAISAALDEVGAAGLAAAIDLGNTNTYGGCFNARYSRDSGFLSRHAYAMAIDMNTTSNCQGCVPHMNCDVVRIFRKHGFAWGGNFRNPDGMHFEWVGERRDQIPYASRYCPNLASSVTQSVDETQPEVDEIGRDVLLGGLDESAIAGFG